MNIKNQAQQYLSELKTSLDNLPLDKLEIIADLLWEAYQNGRQIFVIGNGGSAATASHFVCDFAKGCSLPGKKGFKVIGLTDNVPLLTAFGNDRSYDDIFVGQLESLLEKGDLLVAFTSSGNSKNILKAIELTNHLGAKTIAFTGFSGGKVEALAQISLVVPANCVEQIEDAHLILEHLLHLYFLDVIRAERA